MSQVKEKGFVEKYLETHDIDESVAKTEKEVAEIAEVPKVTLTSAMNKVKGSLKGGPTPQKREAALQLCMQLPDADQAQMIEYINRKLPEEVTE